MINPIDLDEEGYLSMRFPDNGIETALVSVNSSTIRDKCGKIDWNATDNWRMEGMGNLPNLRDYGWYYKFDAQRHKVLYVPSEREGLEEDIGLSHGSQGGRYIHTNFTMHNVVRASVQSAKAKKRMIEREQEKSAKAKRMIEREQEKSNK